MIALVAWLFALSTTAGVLATLVAPFYGVPAAYNLAAACSRALRPHPAVVASAPAPPAPGGGHALDRFRRIGIVLAGGGAKGAYQAGALRAIHEFLEANDALGKVRMISGTSIGAWNAVFWLAGLVRPDPGGESGHRRWWRSISVNGIVEFDTWWPLHGNHFCRADPWRAAFERLFITNQAVWPRMGELFLTSPPGGPVHFYFTRSNVERGTLEFSTNRRDLARLAVPGARPGLAGGLVIGGGNLLQALAQLEQAVFASMDIPPLFPYVRMAAARGGEALFEDGGVVDNLPLWFGTQVEECDLLFVLPLNATYRAAVNPSSILARLTRVIDVRQGVIERDAFKFAYLYNELAALRAAGAAAAPGDALGTRALARRHRPVSIFAICPGEPLAINTIEFWKGEEAGAAFDLMYAATKDELEHRFADATRPDWIRMAVVGPDGRLGYITEF
ncbi:MAG TPA: patatin-like phospholipase family protein [Gemmatimonadales bacterium]|nr:patatin-like phospholipase family protein [Gemmatimonadales bacterium]